MTYIGAFVKTFTEANFALSVDVHMNSDVPKSFEIVQVH